MASLRLASNNNNVSGMEEVYKQIIDSLKGQFNDFSHFDETSGTSYCFYRLIWDFVLSRSSCSGQRSTNRVARTLTYQTTQQT